MNFDRNFLLAIADFIDKQEAGGGFFHRLNVLLLLLGLAAAYFLSTMFTVDIAFIKLLSGIFIVITFLFGNYLHSLYKEHKNKLKTCREYMERYLQRSDFFRFIFIICMGMDILWLAPWTFIYSASLYLILGLHATITFIKKNSNT